MSSLSLKSSFSAAHFYNQPRWSEEKNSGEFGLCYSEYGHGHDYVLEVSFGGESEELLQKTSALQQKIEGLTSQLDHQHLNFRIPEFKETVPTTENIALYFWNKLKSPEVLALKLYETSDLWVEVRA
jgi:6-pyruvoyltetrahydropterin/6-carboxytetrahydropterin synthase